MEILIGILVAIIIISLLKAFGKNRNGASAVVNEPVPSGPSTVDCKEYLNNTGSVARGVNYIDRFGVIHTDVIVDPNQSICVQVGTLHGGDAGFLIELGNC